MLNGCISSREDHGYIVDIGIGKVKAFLGWKEARQYETERNLGEVHARADDRLSKIKKIVKNVNIVEFHDHIWTTIRIHWNKYKHTCYWFINCEIAVKISVMRESKHNYAQQ